MSGFNGAESRKHFSQPRNHANIFPEKIFSTSDGLAMKNAFSRI
jgi:hypothetical protein